MFRSFCRCRGEKQKESTICSGDSSKVRESWNCLTDDETSKRKIYSKTLNPIHIEQVSKQGKAVQPQRSCNEINSKSQNDDRKYGELPEALKSCICSVTQTNEIQKVCGENINLELISSSDIVPAFNIEGWPFIANEWVYRKRLSPTPDVLIKVLKTKCQIVAKRPLFPELKGNPNSEDHSPEYDKHDTYFRVSFSRCELVLATSFNENQLYVWRVVKAYQKKYFETEPRVLTSYLWKNVVFWVFEKSYSATFAKTCVLPAVVEALDFMIDCLQKRFLPHYFVRKANLLRGCRVKMIDEVCSKVKIVKKNPLQHLKSFFENPPKRKVVSVKIKDANKYLTGSTDSFAKIQLDLFGMSEEFVEVFGGRLFTVLLANPENMNLFPSLIKMLDFLRYLTGLDETNVVDVESFENSILNKFRYATFAKRLHEESPEDVLLNNILNEVPKLVSDPSSIDIVQWFKNALTHFSKYCKNKTEKRESKQILKETGIRDLPLD